LTQIFISKKFEKEVIFGSSVLAWIRIELKCWIRIESIRIHNPDISYFSFFPGLVWLREQILHGGGPVWLEPEVGGAVAGAAGGGAAAQPAPRQPADQQQQQPAGHQPAQPGDIVPADLDVQVPKHGRNFLFNGSSAVEPEPQHLLMVEPQIVLRLRRQICNFTVYSVSPPKASIF
jgi:hypothetical protein